MGPRSVPVVSEEWQAAEAPELAVLSALAHHGETRVLDTLAATLQGADVEQAQLYADYVLAALPQAARLYLEELMATGTYEYQSSFAQRYVAEGRTEGKADAVLAVLDARGVALTEEARQRITGCTEQTLLDTWVRRAATVTTCEELFV